MGFVVDKVALEQVISEYFDVPPVKIIPSMRHIHLRLRVALTARTNWRSLARLPKKYAVSESEGQWRENYFTVFSL